MLIGYARVSTQDQHLELQTDALEKAGCKKVFTDKISGIKSERPGLDECLKYIREGDTFVVWKLDRLGRSLQHLCSVVNDFHSNNIGFRSLQENINTDTTTGKLFFHIFAALAEFERDLIKERTNAGLSAARARGRLGGRPKILDARKESIALALYKTKQHPIDEICETVGISKSTLYRCLKRYENKDGGN